MKPVGIQRNTSCQVLHAKGKNFNRADSLAKWGKAEQGTEPENITVTSKTR